MGDEKGQNETKTGKPGSSTYPFKFVSREEWGALPATSKIPPLRFPIKHFTYKFTSTKACNNREDCVKILQEIQKTHMLVKGLPDIAYNFIIGGDKTVYEGRGWFGKPTKLDDKHAEYDGKTLDIAYMGMPFGGVKNNFYCVEILDLRDAIVEYGAEQEYMDENALYDRIDLWDDN